ncbi:hypothetical protein [Dickeya fangzhongdai]|uniref:hypothetical protein n=1 Tax=Dickeya fangzhongdai TaxID=1778540 RepID=UPI002B25E3D8|nr:hypothetical protein [Dickeya fangzhongdai]WOX99935.1 hypothetical protein OGM22_20415 [Dickeya fangzhongdai]WOY04916.1 hypothetical protein OGM21_02010 [Dickeya fangzhongdai]
MKETGLIFNGEMVRAILDGRKTQTRRIVKGCEGAAGFSPEWDIKNNEFFAVLGEKDHTGMNPVLGAISCPFGAVGDRIWVRETFSCIGNEDGHPVNANGDLCERENAQRIYKASAIQKPNNYGLWTSPDGFDFDGTWTPSIHMPRWASRITLGITGVRVERLNDISDADGRAEGCWRGRGFGSPDLAVSPADEFPTLWASIYGAESWQANPWVWVIEFRRI